MLARDKIRQLAERYALAVDGKDLDGIAALFVGTSTTDGTVPAGKV